VEDATETPRVRAGKPLNVWIPEELRDAFDRLRKRTRLSVTNQAIVILEKYLADAGVWTPADSAEEAE